MAPSGYDETSAHDDQLMCAVREGDVDRLGVLFERYHRPLFGFFARLTADRQASEDLVQEVFLRVLRSRHTYRPGSQFRTWMYQIARNVWIDRRHVHGREVPIDESLDSINGYAGPGVAAERSQEVRFLKQALGALAPDKREVLVLSRYQGLKYDDVAEILGCETNTVKVRVHRALKELRAHFFELTGRKTSWQANT